MNDQESEQKKVRSASKSSLPIVSVISDHDTFAATVKLLKEGAKLAAQKDALEQREKEVREELALVCEAYELKGFRHGLIGFEYHGYTTRKTLSKEKLLAAGVAADVIADAYVDGKPFLSMKLVRFDLE